MNKRNILKKALNLAVAVAAASAVLAGGVTGVAAGDVEDAERAYKEARRTLNNDEYKRAAEQFAQVYQQYAETKYAARALYWEAYSFYKIGGKSDLKNAEKALEVHLDKYSDTSTREDATELYYRVLGQLASKGDKEAAEKLAKDTDRDIDVDHDSDADLEAKLAALHALVNMKSDKALPMLEKLLADPDPKNAELREQSLFLISQYDSDEAVDILMRVAREDPDPEVRQNAIFWLSQTDSDKAGELLEELLIETDDPEMMEKVIFSLSQIGDERAMQALKTIALDKSRPAEVRSQAIFWLGQSGGLDDVKFLKDLYGQIDDDEMKESVIFSVSQHSRNSDWLIDIINDKTESSEIRAQALFWAGQSDAIDPEGIADLYRTSKDPELREQAIFALSQRSGSKKTIQLLIELAREEKDPEMRRQIVFWIGQSNDPAAEEFLLEIIND
jgi:HEAT repeat protein